MLGPPFDEFILAYALFESAGLRIGWSFYIERWELKQDWWSNTRAKPVQNPCKTRANSFSTNDDPQVALG